MDLGHYARFLAHLPVFRGLTAAEIADVCRTFRARNLMAGEVLCREGEAAGSMFVIEIGRARVTKRTAQGDEQELAVLKPPSVVGEMALVDGGVRSATVTALEPVMAYEVVAEEFDHLRRNDSTAAYKVVRNLAVTLCERLRDANARIDAFFADPAASLARLRQRQQELWRERQRERA